MLDVTTEEFGLLETKVVVNCWLEKVECWLSILEHDSQATLSVGTLELVVMDNCESCGNMEEAVNIVVDSSELLTVVVNPEILEARLVSQGTVVVTSLSSPFVVVLTSYEVVVDSIVVDSQGTVVYIVRPFEFVVVIVT